MTVECNICGEEFDTAQGLAGHRRFKHSDETTNRSEGSGSRSMTRSQPLDMVIENLRLPQVPEQYNGSYNVYVAGFNDGVMHGARSILAGIRAAQELSTVGVQQATPLIKMAQEMRHAEGQAAEQLAVQLGQLTTQSNHEILTAIRGLAAAQGQPPPEETNPMMKAMASAAQPFLGQIFQQLFSSFSRLTHGGMSGKQPSVLVETPSDVTGQAERSVPSLVSDEPPPGLRPGEEEEFSEI